MGEVQLWQAEGLGADKETLERVLHVFRSDGVQGINSQQALNRYIKKLSDDSLRNMCAIDEETACTKRQSWTLKRSRRQQAWKC